MLQTNTETFNNSATIYCAPIPEGLNFGTVVLIYGRIPFNFPPDKLKTKIFEVELLCDRKINAEKSVFNVDTILRLSVRTDKVIFDSQFNKVWCKETTFINESLIEIEHNFELIIYVSREGFNVAVNGVDRFTYNPPSLVTSNKCILKISGMVQIERVETMQNQ